MYLKTLASIILLSLLTVQSIATATPAKPQDKTNTPPRKETETFFDKSKQKDQDFTTTEAAAIFVAISERLKTDYVEKKTNRELLEGALGGMIDALDPHSAYMNPEKFKEFSSATTGAFGGLGMEVTMENGTVKVMNPMEGTPAAKADIRPGDYILAVDDEPLSTPSLYDAVKKLKGEPGTKIKLTLRRDNDFIDKNLVRAIIKVDPIKHKIENHIGYLKIMNFSKETVLELSKAIKDIQAKEGNKLLGYVIDLRNNFGGLLDQGVGVTQTFLSKGTIVSIRGRDKKILQEFKADGEDQTKGLPLVVLINGNSASASEIVSAALQDNRRAIIVGTKSFGKGSVQEVRPLKDLGGMSITIAFFYAPSGRPIQKDGVTPDIIVEQVMEMKTINSDKGLREAYLKDSLDESKSKEEKSPVADNPQSKDSTDKTQSKDKEKQSDEKRKKLIESISKAKNFKDLPDYQLQQAYSILQALNLDRKMLSGDKSD